MFANGALYYSPSAQLSAATALVWLPATVLSKHYRSHAVKKNTQSIKSRKP